jgi:hypothetical protein
MLARTTARTAAFMPGASPPEVNTAMFLIAVVIVVSFKRLKLN